MRWIVGVAVGVGTVILALGLVYIFVPAHSLPGVLGGTQYVAHHQVFYRNRRGAALAILGTLIVIGAGLAYVVHRDFSDRWKSAPTA